MKAFGVLMSSLSLGFAAFGMFFTERAGEEKEAPKLEYLWSIGLLAYANVLASTIIVTLMFNSSKLVGFGSVCFVIVINEICNQLCNFK
jgi:hypothetical protein